MSFLRSVICQKWVLLKENPPLTTKIAYTSLLVSATHTHHTLLTSTVSSVQSANPTAFALFWNESSRPRQKLAHRSRTKTQVSIALNTHWNQKELQTLLFAQNRPTVRFSGTVPTQSGNSVPKQYAETVSSYPFVHKTAIIALRSPAPTEELEWNEIASPSCCDSRTE